MLSKLLSFFKKKEPEDKIGKIKYFNTRKGYGFIQSDVATKDVFVHASELRDKIRKGDEVQFKLQFSDKGLYASDVRLHR